jgi:hypothetical protein
VSVTTIVEGKPVMLRYDGKEHTTRHLEDVKVQRRRWASFTRDPGHWLLRYSPDEWIQPRSASWRARAAHGNGATGARGRWA